MQLKYIEEAKKFYTQVMHQQLEESERFFEEYKDKILTQFEVDKLMSAVLVLQMTSDKSIICEKFDTMQRILNLIFKGYQAED